MMFKEDRGYFYGALLGDGHINYTARALESASDPENRRGPMVMLKAIDLDFVTAWRDSIHSITGFKYAISKRKPGANGNYMQHFVRCADRVFVDECEEITKHKTVIPKQVLYGERGVQLAFIRGLMDSEGWIQVRLSPLGQSDMTLGFACADVWFDDFYKLVQSVGVHTSKVYVRPAKPKKNGEMGKVIRLFKLNIVDYMNVGLGFTIKRKQDRLGFCSRILNDFTQGYPKYDDYFSVEDKVSSASKDAAKTKALKLPSLSTSMGIPSINNERLHSENCVE